MVGQFIILMVGAICLSTCGFVGGLTWSARELGASAHRAAGLVCCLGFAAIGVACLVFAGAVA